MAQSAQVAQPSARGDVADFRPIGMLHLGRNDAYRNSIAMQQ